VYLVGGCVLDLSLQVLRSFLDVTNVETIRSVPRIRVLSIFIGGCSSPGVRFTVAISKLVTTAAAVVNDRNVISTFPAVGAFLAVISAHFRD